MSTVPHAARAATIGGALVLGAAALAGAPPALAPRAQAEDGITCDDRVTGKPKVYPGKHASDAYDLSFGLGPKVPALKTHVPQGIAALPNGGPGKDLLVVSSYRTGKQARLIAINPSTGKHVGTVLIAPTHAGGIAIARGWAFVQGRGDTVRKYRVSQLRKKLTAQGRPYLKQVGKARKVYSADFLSSYGKSLYAGRFNDKGRGRMYRYTIGKGGSLKTAKGAYEVPKKTQGLLVVKDHFIYTTSYGNDKRSNIYLVDGGARKITKRTAECFRAPSMAEGIARLGEAVYVVYESGAAKYVKKKPRNVIKSLHKAALGNLLASG